MKRNPFGAGLAPFLLAANEAERFPTYNGQMAPGTFDLTGSNESAFESAFYDQPLTDYLVGGWDNDPLAETLDFFAPEVPVSRRFTYKTHDVNDAFIRDEGDEDIRPIGADFREMLPDNLGEVNARTENKGFKVIIDKDELAGDPGKEQREVNRAIRRLLRNELRRAIAAIDAAATAVTPTWDGSSDPDQYLRGQLTTAETSGMRPNKVAYGSLAWDYRDKAHRAQDVAGSIASAQWTPEQLAAYLMVDMLSWGDPKYRSAADTLSRFIGNVVYMFNGQSGVSEEDPSNIKRFVSNTQGGQRLAVYRDDTHAKLLVLTIEHYSLLKITSTLGIRKATVTSF
jgi:hypothetical protein